eukprot:TRINITY_DN4158_c0_g1_i1.p1 TRINITY_DN4158_c0_g1~~TRINITY_DN4158_c0_g1_i1.p1  ORF type:complete len:312 (+),score=74.18 TRINITY_DN4158_c0_g1_i1:63-998(+)
MLKRTIQARCPAQLFKNQQKADFTPEMWGGAATEYERAFGGKLESYARQVIEDHMDRSNMGAVLDVGCGTGAVWDALKGTGAQCKSFTGIDYSEDMINKAKQKLTHTPSPFPHNELHIMDGTAMSFNDSSFDTIFAMFSLLFFTDKLKGMQEIHRVLRPSGNAVIGCWAPVQTIEWVHYSNVALKSVLGSSLPKIRPENKAELPNFQTYANPLVLKADLVKAGFLGDCVSVAAVTRTFSFKGAVELERLWLDMSLTYPSLSFVMNTFPKDEIKDIKAEVAKSFATVVHEATQTTEHHGVLRGTANVALCKK